MGFYVTLDYCDLTIPESRVEDAFEAVCNFNARNEFKAGRRLDDPQKPILSKSIGHPRQWFSGMDWNYDETCSDLQEVLEQVGFGVFTHPDGDISIDDYCNDKKGAGAVFLLALAPFILDGSSVEWIGEDRARWNWEFNNGRVAERGVVFDLL